MIISYCMCNINTISIILVNKHCYFVPFCYLYRVFRSLAVGGKNGYRLFSVSSVDRMDCIHQGGMLKLHFILTTSLCTNYSIISI